MKDIVKFLLKAPGSQLDHSMFPMIEKWSDPPKAIEVLEVMDRCVRGSLSSDFVVRVMDIELQHALSNEKITMETLEKQAPWRKE